MRSVRHVGLFVVSFVLVATTLVASSEPSAAHDHLACDQIKAVVTDIDETLTKSNAEFVMELIFGTTPVERPSAAETMQAYADKGYVIVYVTARFRGFRTLQGVSATMATRTWLEELGYPADPDSTMIYLAPDLGATLRPAHYKASVVRGLEADGMEVEYGYGNADTDWEGFIAGGVPEENVCGIGSDTLHLPEEQRIPGGTYVDHLADYVINQPDVCTPSTEERPPLECPVLPYQGWLTSLLGEGTGFGSGGSARLPCH